MRTSSVLVSGSGVSGSVELRLEVQVHDELDGQRQFRQRLGREVLQDRDPTHVLQIHRRRQFVNLLLAENVKMHEKKIKQPNFSQCSLNIRDRPCVPQKRSPFGLLQTLHPIGAIHTPWQQRMCCLCLFVENS